MIEMTPQKMTEYLKYVSELETSVYKQTEVINRAKRDLKKPEVYMQKHYCPNCPTCPTPINASSLSSYIFDFGECTAAWIIGVIFFVCCLLAFAISDEEFRLIWVVLCLIGTIISFGIPVLKGLGEYLVDKKEYPRKLKEYEQRKIQYEKDFQRYADATKKEQEKFRADTQKAEEVYRTASIEVAKLDKPLMETQKLLSKFYDKDVIFPKYRNMVAMCTMYEYFASGRCTELTGPTGAYNLYEAELRQNLIISQLEQVNTNLEQVRQNQYILYQGISETNQTLANISEGVKGILAATTDIAISSRITAFCTEVTSYNAIAQTTMQMWD